MTDLKSSLEHPVKMADLVTSMQVTLDGAETETMQMDDSPECSESVKVFLVRPPRTDSKLILKNMEEVLNSVNKKHRQKHRRIREQRKLALIEAKAAGSNESKTNATLSDPLKTGKRRKKHHNKAPQENGVGHPKISHHRSCSIMNHFSLTPKTNVGEKETAEATLTPSTEVPLSKTGVGTNAFEVLMNARNKVIGSNASGREASKSPEKPALEDNIDANLKRKQILQQFAEKKGRTKRRLEEESRAAYVERQLENRAKRLKRMLVNGANESDPETSAVSSTSLKIEKKNTSSKRRTLAVVDKTVGKMTANKIRLSKQRTELDVIEILDHEKVGAPKVDLVTEMSLKQRTAQVCNTTSAMPAKKGERIVHSAGDVATKPTSRSSVSRAVARYVTEIDHTTPRKQSKNAPVLTSSGRPKRSCVGKARYDYDLQESPTKIRKSGITSTPRSTANNSLVEVVDLDNSDSNLISKQEPVKLAPLFIRSLPKPTVDPETLKARREFLTSGVPERVHRENVKRKRFQMSFEKGLQLYPQTSHVQQLTIPERQFFEQVKEVNFNLMTTVQDEIGMPRDGRRSKSKVRWVKGIVTNCSLKNLRATCNKSYIRARALHDVPLPRIPNKHDIVRSWKTYFERFPTFKCYNQMREKYRYFNAIDSTQDTEQVTESVVVTRHTRRSFEKKSNFDASAEEEEPPSSAPNGELLFSDKYKPLFLDQVLVNSSFVTKLRDFLASWSDGNNAGNMQNSDHQDDSRDFLNDLSCSNQYTTCNSVVLLGPISSGKTNAVFALANEMNFNVLEINAGMKRTGKKLIQELQEATQSHQIRKESKIGITPKSLTEMSTNGSRFKKTRIKCDDSDSSSTELSQTVRKSLVLIEDADIVFETDAGFTDAINTLAASSKRPVIIVASNPNCAHLQRLINQNSINFCEPNVLNTSRFLAILSLIENCPIDLSDLISLYLYNNNDLRKTLHELQFFIQSGGDYQRYDMQKKETPRKSKRLDAAPSKSLFGELSAAIDSCGHDEQLYGETERDKKDAIKKLYTHQTLFDFYTINQNESWRVPFPIDFRVLCCNLSDIFSVAPALNLCAATSSIGANGKKVCATKRKSRSPKKAWLRNATAPDRTVAPLDLLCDFYDNISMAAAMGAQSEAKMYFGDRLVPHLSEEMAHDIVEKAIKVNLAANLTPYRLLNTATKKYCLSNYLDTSTSRCNRARDLDFEPALRAICRSEKCRSTKERRSTRFYHYLRSSLVNGRGFATAQLERACEVFHQSSSVKSTISGDATCEKID